MAPRSRGALAGFGWLKRGVGISFRHRRPLLGAAAILVAMCLLPSLVALPVQMHLLKAGIQPGPIATTSFMVGSWLFGLLIVPLYAGYLTMIDAAERGRPPRASDIFGQYRQGQAPRLIAYGLVLLVIYIALFAIVILAFGGDTAQWYQQALTAQASHQPPPSALPGGFWLTLALFMLLCFFMMGVYAISLGQLTLRQRSVLGAIADGVTGTLKNALPMLVFLLGMLLASIGLIVTVALVGGLLALLGNFVSVWLAIALFVVLYVAWVLLAFAVTFGMMYALWHDVCAEELMTSAPAELLV